MLLTFIPYVVYCQLARPPTLLFYHANLLANESLWVNTHVLVLQLPIINLSSRSLSLFPDGKNTSFILNNIDILVRMFVFHKNDRFD